MLRQPFVALHLILLTGLVACGDQRRVDTTFPDDSTGGAFNGGGGDGGTRDAGPRDAGGYPAAFQTPPEVVTAGGPVLRAPRIVPVFFSNDTPSVVAKLTDFDARYGTTEMWRQSTREYCYQGHGTTTEPEYCIGDATSAAVVTLPASELTNMGGTQLTDSGIRDWLRTKLENGTGTLPAPDANTIYMLHFPSGVVINVSGGQTCQEVGGYHGEIALSGLAVPKVAYSVIPRCMMFSSFAGIDATTAAESHELIEAATDPFPDSDPAFSSVDAGHGFLRYFLGGTEVGDMCAQEPGGFETFAGFPYVVQRGWSNVSAKEGHNPCAPALPNEIFFNTVAETPDILNINGQGQFVGIKIPLGQTKTVTLDGYSDADPGVPWDVEVDDGIAAFGGSPELSLVLDKSGARNGDRIQLHVTAPSRTGQFGFEFFRITSSWNGFHHVSWAVVGR